MEDFLNNPVYYALSSGNSHLSLGNGVVKYFDEQVSPFVGFPEDHDSGFAELHQQLPDGRRILYGTRKWIQEPKDWQIMAAVKGLQFLYTGKKMDTPLLQPVPLHAEHVEAMIQLTALTKPGPFDARTIEFGQYYGFFDKEQLVAMTGQRLHVFNYAEISAVCTHPDHLGKGYAAALIQHQLAIITNKGLKPFLHVRDDNTRAIALYERLGFEENGPMNFFFLKRR
jgi:ribosomal protein S18 acetylase RimI-like enzyme